MLFIRSRTIPATNGPIKGTESKSLADNPARAAFNGINSVEIVSTTQIKKTYLAHVRMYNYVKEHNESMRLRFM